MDASQIEAEALTAIDRDCCEAATRQSVDVLVEPFERCIKSYTYFNLAFIALATLEIVLFALCFTPILASGAAGICVAGMFLTLFCYFILRLYLQTKKPLQMRRVVGHFLTTYQRLIYFQDGIPEHHLAVAQACARSASALQGREYTFYTPPRQLEFLSSSLERFSFWCHWEDVYTMRELLLRHAVEEHIKVVKSEPTDLEVHAALANCYVMLSSLYVDYRKRESNEEDRWAPPVHLVSSMREKFLKAAERAMEEFQILNDYAPDDPWIHAQLAYSYRDLQMPEEEIRQYEAILRLRPDDTETRFRLGTLYFQQGHNAKGLRVYEELRHIHLKKAEALISFYGAYEQEVPTPTESSRSAY